VNLIFASNSKEEYESRTKDHRTKTTGQKTTKNANPGQKTTRTKDYTDKRPPSWFFYGEILSHLTVYYFIRERVKNDKKMTLSVFVAV